MGMSWRLPRMVRSMIEVRKESNSTSTIIFNIVWVVFLRLSFVTSYLVIYHRDRGSTEDRTVSFCQRVYHAGLLALADSAFNTGTGLRNQVWPRRPSSSPHLSITWFYLIEMFTMKGRWSPLKTSHWPSDWIFQGGLRSGSNPKSSWIYGRHQPWSWDPSDLEPGSG